MSKQRVLWLAKGLGRGGAERLLVQVIHHLDHDRFEVEVAYVLPWKDALVGELAAAGVKVHCLGEGRLGTKTWPLRLRRLVRDGRFDIVHTHMPSPAVVARLLTGRRGPKLMHTEHNVWQRYRRATYWGNALTYGRNQLVIAVSQGVADSIRRPSFGRGRAHPPVEVLVHGVESSSSKHGSVARIEARRRLGVDLDAKVIGTVGNLTPKKDHKTLLLATLLLLEVHPGLRLIIVGSGPLDGETRAEAHRLGLDRAVIFLGSRNDVNELLPGFDVFALSSRYEGLSIALLEAMAAGVPCVASEVGGVPEILVDADEGYLVPPADAVALAKAVGRILDDPELGLALGRNGREQAKRLDAVGAVRRLESLYAGLAG